MRAPKFFFCTGRYESGDWDSAPLVPENLIDSVVRYTTIDCSPRGVAVPLSSDDILNFPMVYLTGHLPVSFSQSERRNLRRVVDRGGFVFVDDHNHDIDGEFHKTMTAELTGLFGKPINLPDEHELYHCFFKFRDGAPDTSQELNGWGDNLRHAYLQAFMRGDRVGVLYSSKDYSSEWGYHAERKHMLATDNTKFGVNLVVYALTR